MQYDNETIRQAMKMAQTPEGQQLIRLFQSCGGNDLQKAMTNVSNGDYSAAKQALSTILNNPEAQKLLRQMGEKHGTNGR